MTTETQITEGNQTDPNAKGLPPGVTVEQTGETGNRGDGAPKAPEVNNAPPPKEQTAEEKASEAAKTAEAQEAEKKAAEDKAEEDAEKETAEVEVLQEYPDYGDANANAVVSMLQEAKVTAVEAHELFKDAIATGDFTKINMATLTEKLGKGKADLVLLGVQTYYNTTTAAVKDTVTAVHTEVGGEANYGKIQAWARAKAAKDTGFATQVEGLNAMFDLNKTAALMAARELRALYEKDSGNSSLTTKQVHGDSAATTANSGEGYISRGDYLEQLKKAHEKNDTHEINRLRSQRQSSIGK